MHPEWEVGPETKTMGDFFSTLRICDSHLFLNYTCILIGTLIGYLVICQFMGDSFLFTPTSYNLGNKREPKGARHPFSAASMSRGLCGELEVTSIHLLFLTFCPPKPDNCFLP